ncbi:MAG: prepilin-type N-terminal cleavage/methylation domain-containing protein [Phycisphaerae bacterium]|jgi:prepilin-type N-terminal cleavage/methylation domain-containing protein
MSGFTLIEVLVVVAIIALLIAILLPSMERARQQARATVCMSNLKQFAAAFVFYGQDHRQNPPPNRLRAYPGAPVYGTPPDYKDSDWWYYRHMVARYIPPDKLTATNSALFGVFGCPSDPKTAGRSYSMNVFASNYPLDPPANTATPYGPAEMTPFNPFKLKAGYRFMLLGESQADHEDSRHRGVWATDYVIGLNGPTYARFKDIDFEKHKGRVHFLLADLNVASLRKDGVVRRDPTDPSRRLSALTVLWAPQDARFNVAMPE